MNCSKCGANLGANDVFCPKCGTKVIEGNGVKTENTYTYDRPVNEFQNQNYGQLNNNGNQNKQSSNSSDIVKICIAVIIALAIVIGAIFIYKAATSNKNNNENNNKNSSSLDYNNNSNYNNANNSNNSYNNNGGSTVPVNYTNSYSVYYDGFKFNIPDNLLYQINYSLEGIVVGDVEETWAALFQVTSVNYKQLKQNRNNLPIMMTEALSPYEATVSAPKIETIDGVEYIILEINVENSKKYIAAYAEIDATHTIAIEFHTDGNDFNRQNLKEVSKIVKNTTYTGESSYLKTENDEKTKAIRNAIKKAGEEATK